MDWKDLLSAYLDGELAPEWRQKAERLLAESAQARAWLDDLKKVDRALRQVPSLGVSDSLRERFALRAAATLGVQVPLRTAAGKPALRLVGGKRRKAAAKSHSGRWMMAGGAAAVAAALLLALSLGLFNPAATDGNGNGGVATNQPTPAPPASIDTPAPEIIGNPGNTPDPVAGPSDEMLAALDLLTSDVDMVALAALEQEDIDLLGDTEYLAMLASYDNLTAVRQPGD